MSTISLGLAPARPDDSARGAIRAGWIIIALFFGVLGTWAALAPLNAAVVGDAVVKVEGNRKSVQHLDGGTVNKVLVTEGQHVARGDPLLLLDDTVTKADVQVMQQQRLQLLAIEARLTAELNSNERIGFPPDLTGSTDPVAAAAMRDQQQEFDSRATAIAGKREVLARQSAQLEAQITGYRAQRLTLVDQQSSVATERASLKDLLAKGLTTRARVLELERQELAIAGQLADIDARIAASQDAIGQTEQETAQLGKDQAADITNQLREVRGSLRELAPRLGSAEVTLERTIVRAPYAGRVVDLAVFASGSVVGRGERLMDIVPDAANLVVEARIRVEDIADIASGMHAEIHFTSYKQRVTPVIRGEVTNISADRLTDERTRLPYYVAEVAVDPADLARNQEIQLYPGMAAVVMITTRERSALDYLLGPLNVSFDHSFRER
ncbi:MAG: HlyD family type I secretion periplasmic adaptor subunit [Devosia sp.]